MQIAKGRFLARLAVTQGDMDRALALRARVFRSLGSGDGDRFDTLCQHLLVEDQGSGDLVACCRLLILSDGAAITESYSAQYYELTGLSGIKGPVIELGRFCLHPDWHDPDILRLIWGAVAALVGQAGAGLLFGCTSFAGADGAAYLDSFAVLQDRYLPPTGLRPGQKATQVIPFAELLRGHQMDPARGLRRMPALLRTYLKMGGWVSDHAVVDHDLGTLHVFTGLEIAKIPPARAQALRNLAI